MKKILIFILFFALFWWINQSFSATLTTIYWWWQNTWISCPSWTVPKNSDTFKNLWNTTVNSVTQLETHTDCLSHTYYSNWDYTLNTSKNSNTMCYWEDMVIWLSWTKIKCRKYDDIKPQSLSITYTDWWTNSPISITVEAKDRGGSKLKSMILKESNNWWSDWTELETWDNLSYNNNTLVTKTKNSSNTEGDTYIYKLITKDYAWNTTSITNTNEIKIDNTPPTLSATNSSNDWKSSPIDIILHVSNWWSWSPLVYSKYIWDNFNTANCENSWTPFNDNDLITQSTNADHTLYLCTEDEAWNKVTWNWKYKLDTIPPDAPTITADDRNTDEWKNDKTTVLTTTSTSSGPSPLTNYYCMNNDNSLCSPFLITEPSTSNLADWFYYYKAKTCSAAWLCSPSSTFIIKIDTVEPDLTDIFNTWNWNWVFKFWLEDEDYFKAINSKTIAFKIKLQTHAPIEEITTKLEKNNDKNNFNNLIFNQWNSFEITWNNFSTVDTDLNINNFRDYQFNVIKICDEATNCVDIISPEWRYHFNVYANVVDSWKSIISNTSNFTIWNIADWSAESLIIKLKDKYWNEVVKVKDKNWNTIRNVNLNINYDNTLHRNQYTNSGNDTAVFADNITPEIEIEIGKTWTIYNKANWEYYINFKIYSPTENNYTPAKWKFEITSITWEISDTWNAEVNWTHLTNLNTSIDFNFKPLYTTQFSWEQFDNWLIEWVTQTGWLINISKATWWKNITANSWNIKLEKRWLDNTIDDDAFNWKANINNTTYFDFYNNWLKEFLWNLNTWDKNFTSLFTLNPSSPTILYIKKIYLISYINYIIDWKDILYMWDILWWDKWQINAGLKIYWISNISDDKIRDITNNQEVNDIHNINWKIYKASLRKDIRSNAYTVIKNIKIDNTNNNWDPIDIWTKYIYYNFSDWHEGWRLDLNLDTIKNKNITYIIKWWNLYLNWWNSDIIETELPWIIVLKDENWYWWKLYIDPEISRINAAIYVDKSILSYNESYWELSPNNGWTYNTLKKQLYIHGSVFSENTIWGSRLANPVCPFYLGYNNNICELWLDEAQKYDLNYLRRWIMLDDWITESTEKYPVIIKYNTKMQLNPPALFSN